MNCLPPQSAASASFTIWRHPSHLRTHLRTLVNNGVGCPSARNTRRRRWHSLYHM